ncbi:MAG: glycosyltransferase family 2 protein [Gemmatimonadota bacterium]
MPLWLLLTLPWIGLMLFVAFRVKLPSELPPPDEADAAGSTAHLVSVVVPARNEAHNISRLLESLTRSTWPRFEVVVVDDRSTDGTADLARAAAPGNAERIEVVDGEALPEGWMGKPWACWQGAHRARGELLLFTDADTIHGPDLLSRAVAGLRRVGADAVTVVGRQLMETFWERLVQPQIFMTMALRYTDLRRPPRRSRWRSAIANGQYLLFRRETYLAIGGHEAVRDAVVEDLRLAQILVKGGWRFRAMRAEDALATRMYRSLAELVAGWSKNLVLGGVQTLHPWLRPFAPPALFLAAVLWWVVPPAAAVAGLAGVVAGPWVTWAGVVVAVSALFWCLVTGRMGVPWWYGVLYPLGATVSAWIVLRSWLGMRRVEWKGRTYRTGVSSG